MRASPPARKQQAPKLQLVRRAAIQQRTGEVWENVALALSTARPAAGTAAPGAAAAGDRLRIRRPRRPAPAAAERDGACRPRPPDAPIRTRRPPAAGAIREGGGDARDRRGAGLPGRSTPSPAASPCSTRARPSACRSTTCSSIRRSPCARCPSASEKAYLYAKLTVARGTPLLPGQIALFRDATFVGNGRIPLLAAGEEHELGFGVDDAVVVRHALAEEKRSESGIITTSKTDTRSYRITVKNLHERAIPVTVLDQIPVSQNADIKVELTGKTAPSRRDVDDKRGVLAWDMTLAPDEERVIEFGYRATWPAAKKVTYGQGS